MSPRPVGPLDTPVWRVKLEALAGEIWKHGVIDDLDARAILEEVGTLRRLLYEVVHELPTSAGSVDRHSDLQRLHRRVIKALRETEPEGFFVTSDYWIGRTP